MSELGRILIVAFGVALQIGAVRWGYTDWRQPLRERTPVEDDLITRSMLGGTRSPAAIQAQFRIGPVRSVTAFFLILGGQLALLRVRSDAAIYAAFAVGLVGAIIWLLVLLFNRPRWAVPPGSRNASGLLEYKRRYPESEPPLRDPPPPREGSSDAPGRFGES